MESQIIVRVVAATLFLAVLGLLDYRRRKSAKAHAE
jgi:hypothetical protein